MGYEKYSKHKEIYEIYLDKAMKSEDINKAIENMKLAAKYSREKVPEQVINLHKLNGTLYSEKNARSYLMIVGQLGYLYQISGDYENAISVYEELLKLDREDNQNVKDKLIPMFIMQGKYDKAHKLIEIYKKDESATMLYNRALYHFVKGDKFNSRVFIRKAIKENKYVIEYLIGLKNIDFDIKEPIKPGSLDEAKYYFNDTMAVWMNDKNAMLWLVDEYFLYAEKNKIYTDWNKEYIKNIVKKIYNYKE